MPASKKGALISLVLGFFHRSAERWGPDWGPFKLLPSKRHFNSSFYRSYWLPFTAPAPPCWQPRPFHTGASSFPAPSPIRLNFR